MIKILFFAKLRETLGCDSVELACEQASIAQIKEALISQHPEWQPALTQKNVLAAVNQEMVKDSALVYSKDEVAFFPPVTGG